MGMAIDPSFATKRSIYVCMASTLPAAGNDVRLVRWVVNANYTALTNRADIVTGCAGEHAGRAGPPRGLPAAVRTRREHLDRHG